MDFPQNEVKKMIPNLAHSTVVKFYASMRELLYAKVDNFQFQGTVDGKLDIIEIDESLFGKKRKHNKGAPTEKQWVFGMVERTTRKTYFQIVEDRTKDTLIPIIKRKALQGSTIYHDDWSAYRRLGEEGYETDVVVHSREFVSASGACTNTIEGTHHFYRFNIKYNTTHELKYVCIREIYTILHLFG